MELPSFIDEEIISSPSYWILTAGTMLALIIGFKLSGTFAGEGSIGIPTYTKVIILALIPVIAYIVYGRFGR